MTHCTQSTHVAALPVRPAICSRLRIAAKRTGAILVAMGALVTAASGITWHWNYIEPGYETSGEVSEVTNSMNAAVATWNTYASYGFDVGVAFHSGIPTAQASYLGEIGFGGQRNYRVAMHESAHWLGTGTVGEWNAHQRWGVWNGTYITNLRRAFDGPGERQFIYGVHYGPDGANYDNEWPNGPRFVGVVGAFRRDMNLSGGDQTIGIASGTYRLRSRISTKVLDGIGATTPGSFLKQHQNGGGNGQLWNVSLIEGTTHFTLQNVASGLYLDSLGATANGPPVAMTSLVGAPTDHQLWEIQQTDSFFFKIVNKGNGKGIDNFGLADDGGGMVQWDAAGNWSWNQHWTFLHSMPQLTPPAGVVSQGRPVRSSTTDGGNFDSKGNNGVAGDRWTASGGSYPQWWQVDTGSVQPITRVEVDWFKVGALAFQYNIEVSDNGSDWSIAANRTGNTTSGTTVDQLIGVTGRFVRVTVSGATPGSYWAAFHECRVYNEAQPMKQLSLFRPTTASSDQAGNLAVNANDVDPVFTRWCANSSGFPAWWQVDLGSAKQVNKAVITWFDDDARSYQYRIEGSTDGVNFTTLIDRTSNTSAYSTSDTFSGMARWVRVTITGGTHGWPSIYDAQIFGATTLAPTNLAGSASGEGISLTWTATPGATSYNVKRSTTSGGPYTTIATGVSGTGYTDNTAFPGKPYYYVVASASGAGEGEQSAEIRVDSPGTIALWDFEDGVNGQFFTPSGSPNGSGGSVDIMSGILMRGWNHTNGPSWKSAVAPNGGSLAMDNADSHQDGYVTEGALHGWAPTAWTIECTVYLEELAGWKTLIGRDGSSQGEAESDFYLQKRGDNGKFRINIDTVGGQRWNLDGEYAVQPNTWYALAARSDGTTLSLWLDDGAGYQQIGSLDISAQSVAQNALPATNLSWTFGRGWYGGGFVDHIDGRMDNIRFTTGALATGDHLRLEPLTPLERWRFAHFGTTANAGNAADAADPDGDGSTNTEEYAAGTNPNDSASVFKIASVTNNGEGMVISFPTVSGRSYTVKSSATLETGSWAIVQTSGGPAENIAGTGSSVQITDSSVPTEPRRFYRVETTPQP